MTETRPAYQAYFHMVYNLPMRFTAHKDREGGAFKNTQCTLVGWELPPEEETRVTAIQENEITLHVMPIALHVKLLRPTRKFKSNLGPGLSFFSLSFDFSFFFLFCFSCCFLFVSVSKE